MNPLDRIAQLTEANTRLQEHIITLRADVAAEKNKVTKLTRERRDLCSRLRESARSVSELRSQVETARQELASEAGTIAKLAKDKRELLRAVRDLLDFADPDSVPGDITIEKWKNAVSTYSRHA